MTKKLFIVLFIYAVFVNVSFGQETDKLIYEGFMFSGAEGEVSFDRSKNNWFFILSRDVNDSFIRIEENTQFPVLPSAALERLCVDVNERVEPTYRLWGRVTQYKNRNYVFPAYFFSLARVKNSEKPVASERPEAAGDKQERQVRINEPEDSIVIPKNILKKLSGRSFVRQEQVREEFEVEADTIISDRMAHLEETSEGNIVFVLDSLGRNASTVRLKALPSQALEYAQRIQESEPEDIYFRISGLLTKYKGDYYLLLQRAARVYGYQNFSG